MATLSNHTTPELAQAVYANLSPYERIGWLEGGLASLIEKIDALAAAEPGEQPCAWRTVQRHAVFICVMLGWESSAPHLMGSRRDE